MANPPPEQVPRRTLLAALGLLAVGAGPVLAACARASTPGGSGAALRPIGGSDLARVAVALSAAPDLSAVVAGMDALTARLHAQAASTATNFTISPLSVAVAFGMLRAGARGDTARQIDAVLGFAPSARPEGSPHEALNALTAALVTPPRLPSSSPAPAPVVAIANALFVADGFGRAVQPAFADLLAAQYGAHADAVDFTSPTATAAINAWVAEQTRGRITKLFDQLDPGTVMVLANAVYLKATWLSQFSPPMTATGAFTTAAATSVQVPMMRQTYDQARYAETAGWQRITLPYVGWQLSMRVVLPRSVPRDAAALAALLAPATATVSADAGTWVDLTLPRWRTETDLDLLPVLARLGLTALSDLAGIAPGVSVSQAVHRATITVDETGSEAAAVTGVAITSSGRVGEPVPMRVDRPFVWAVVHDPTGTPVFVGHVVDPTR